MIVCFLMASFSAAAAVPFFLALSNAALAWASVMSMLGIFILGAINRSTDNPLYSSKPATKRVFVVSK
jgi:hypothetical protein